MSPSNGSNGGSTPYDDALDAVLADAEEAHRLAQAARAALDDPAAIEQAARTLEKAYETESESRREKLVARALELDPGCIDALTLIARSFEDPTDAATLLEAAVEVGERRLGPATFQEGRGRFWDIYETRPYMRALFALAEAEMDAMSFNNGLELYDRLLELSHTDALGVRYTLAGALLVADRLEQARKLAFEQFHDDQSAAMLWARTLILLLERDFDGAAAMLERAKGANGYVEQYLSGDLELAEEPASLSSPGSVEEAEIIASHFYLAWRLRPLSIVWLKVGGKPGDDRYFGGYTDVELQELFDEAADEDDFFEDDDEPYLLN